jgi:hypothetical protein
MNNEEKSKALRVLNQEFLDMVDEDLKIPYLEQELIETCRNSPNIIQKYLEHLFSAKRESEILDRELNILYTKLYKKYRYGIITSGERPAIRVDTAKDADILITGEEDYIKLMKKCGKQKIIVEYLEKIVQNFKDRQYQIKNIIEIKNLERT